jgi:ADP-ribose pyrophosphatase YjhB (NUDIX family)
MNEPQFIADMELEGPPEKEFHSGIAARIPSKPVAAGALLQDEDGRILFLTPTYKPYLEIPGGIVNEGESPQHACQREIFEEIGLSVTDLTLLLVDWHPQHGIWRDSIQFIFDGGTLTAKQIDQIRVQPDEVTHYELARLEHVAKRLKASMYRRIFQATLAKKSGIPRYSEFGRS